MVCFFFFWLSNLALLCYVAVSGSHMETTARILLASPVLVFALIILAKVFRLHLPKCCACSKHLLQKVMKAKFMGEAEQSSANDTPTAGQPLIQPTSTVLSYGTHTKWSKNDFSCTL